MLLRRHVRLLIIIPFFVFMLSGCWDRKPNYKYLMLHPEYLQRVYNQCIQEVTDPALPCETIMRAQADFTRLSNEREQDPERFGARVLQAQQDAIFQKTQFEAAQQAYKIVGKTKPDLEELRKMRSAVDKTRVAYRSSLETVQILLQVISATSSV